MHRWLLLCCLLILPLQASELDKLNFITEEYPPYNYQVNGQLRGTSVDILQSILRHSQSAQSIHDVRVLPWARGYDTTLEFPDTVLFSTTRSRTRDHLFEWVGPLAAGRVVLLARRDSAIQFDSIADLISAGHSVVALREDIGQQVLQEAGVPESQIRTAVNNLSAMHMLARGRVDLWAYGEDVAHWLLQENGQNLADYETVLLLTEDPLYFAVNRQSDPAAVKALQQALDQLRSDGTLPALK